jgi:hypothetical protein
MRHTYILSFLACFWNISFEILNCCKVDQLTKKLRKELDG